jgi:hypothetical protein
MRKTDLSQRHGPAPSLGSDVLKFFPFVPDASWYQQYWYERQPGRIQKLVGCLSRLLPGRNPARRGSRSAIQPVQGTSPGRLGPAVLIQNNSAQARGT